MKKEVLPQILIVVIVAILIIALIIYAYNEDKKIKDTNVKMYNYLICVDDCDIVYNFNLGSMGAMSEFNDSCIEDCTLKIGTLSFRPGQLEKGKLLMESNEYLECVRLLNTKGAEFYKNCVEKMLPMFQERYPEVVGK